MSECRFVAAESAENGDGPLTFFVNHRRVSTRTRNADSLVLSSDVTRAPRQEPGAKRIEQQPPLNATRFLVHSLGMIPGQLLELAALIESLCGTTYPVETHGDSLPELGMALEITAERLEAIRSKLLLTLPGYGLGIHQLLEETADQSAVGGKADG